MAQPPGIDDVGGGNVQRLPVVLGFTGPLAAHHDIDAVIAEDALKLADIGQARDIVENERLIGEQARDHQRQGGVLGAGDRDCPVELLPTGDANAVHAQSPVLANAADPLRNRRAMQKGQPVRAVAAAGLAALLMCGNSGGIVGLVVGLGAVVGVGPGRACSPFRLGLAALEILPQCRAQASLLACFLRALGTIVHGGQDKRRGSGKEGPRKGRRSLAGTGRRLRRCGPYGKDRRIRGRIPSPFASGPALP
jgi:hypothetical protein